MNASDQRISYDAFISYASKDRSVAKRIQTLLQGFRDKSSQKVLKIFMDDTDLAGGDLPIGITAALEKSRHLIVCCSPAAANSKWVGMEIETFLRLHNNGLIAPILISGKHAQSIPTALQNRQLKVLDARNGMIPFVTINPARDELFRLLSLLSGRELREIINWNRRKFVKQSAYSSVALLTGIGGMFYYIQQQKEVKTTDVRAEVTLYLMIDEGLGEGEQLKDWYAADAELTLAIYKDISPKLRGNGWPWRSDTFPLHENAITLLSRNQTQGLNRRASTAGTWTTAERTFSAFSGNLKDLLHPKDWNGLYVEARLRAIEDKGKLETQEKDVSTKAMSAFLSYYSVSREKLTQLEDADAFIRPMPIVAAIRVFVADKPIYSAQGIPIALTEHDDDARRLHLIHFPLSGSNLSREVKP